MSQDSNFNSDVVRTLAEILNETNLTEIEYKGPEYKIKVVRHVPVAPAFTMPNVISQPLSSQVFASSSATDQQQPLSSAAVDLSAHSGAIKAPMVGTAYMSPAPGASNFVSVGDAVVKGQTLMIIEAMKVMNQIKSHVDGVVKQILCKDGDPVEYDQILAVIE